MDTRSCQKNGATEFLVGQGKYRLGRKIGSGSFGDIYLGELVEYDFILYRTNFELLFHSKIELFIWIFFIKTTVYLSLWGIL